MLDVLITPKKRILFFNKQVDQLSIGEITQNIIEINEHDDFLKNYYQTLGLSYNPKPIKIYIDSYGGMIYQCFGLLSVMETSKTPIHTIVTGCAMSCGFMILINGHKRFAYELSTPLYHTVSNVLNGPIKEIEDDAKEMKRIQKQIDKIVLKKTKIQKNKIKEIYNTKTDWYMNSTEALKYGVIDEIIK